MADGTVHLHTRTVRYGKEGMSEGWGKGWDMDVCIPCLGG